MIRRFLVIALLAIGARVSHAQPSLPSSFQARTIRSPEAADIFVRWGGKGPVVVLIHGYAENSDSWAPLAADLMKDHTVVVPDLRGIGKSSKPESGYDEKTQAKDIRAVVTGLTRLPLLHTTSGMRWRTRTLQCIPTRLSGW